MGITRVAQPAARRGLFVSKQFTRLGRAIVPFRYPEPEARAALGGRVTGRKEGASRGAPSSRGGWDRNAEPSPGQAGGPAGPRVPQSYPTLVLHLLCGQHHRGEAVVPWPPAPWCLGCSRPALSPSASQEPSAGQAGSWGPCPGGAVTLRAPQPPPACHLSAEGTDVTGPPSPGGAPRGAKCPSSVTCALGHHQAAILTG